MMPACKRYAEGRFVGLHSSCPTDIERDYHFKLLARASKRPSVAIPQNASRFIGGHGDRVVRA
jgi:hypothetical protein